MPMMDRAEALAALDAANIAYELEEHPAVYTIEQMQELAIDAHGTVIKNLFLRDAKGKRHFLVCLREDRRADLEALRAHFGSTKLSFGSPERLAQYLGLLPGAVTPLGALHAEPGTVEVAFDSALQGEARIGIHPADNTATVWLRADDLLALLRAHGVPVSLFGC